MPVLNINTDAVVRFTANLERMHRSALPVAIRGALNNAAFDVKKTTMPEGAARQFEKRKPNFFKANSKVEQARGFDVGSMKATVGFTGNDQAVEDLEQQERGGDIGGRALIPLQQARTGSNWRKNVRANARVSEVRGKIKDPGNVRGKNVKVQFIKSAVHAGKGGWVKGNTPESVDIVFQIKSLRRVQSQRHAGMDTQVKAVPMFSIKKGRKVKPRATHFMQQASEQSASKLGRFYVEQAEKQIARLR